MQHWLEKTGLLFPPPTKEHCFLLNKSPKIQNTVSESKELFSRKEGKKEEGKSGGQGKERRKERSEEEEMKEGREEENKEGKEKRRKKSERKRERERGILISGTSI